MNQKTEIRLEKLYMQQKVSHINADQTERICVNCVLRAVLPEESRQCRRMGTNQHRLLFAVPVSEGGAVSGV